jgi:hypothetical protein
MKTTATNRKIRVILTDLREGHLTPSPAFQRRLVWSTKHKNAFIETVLNGLPFPEIFIAAGKVNPDTGEGQELIVDGQQRVTTLYQYFTASPDLMLGTSIPPYSSLTDERKLAFLEYEVVVRDLGALTEDQTRDLFNLINSASYALNAMEVNNARYDGPLKRFCDGLSEDPFFEKHSTFNSFDAKRMNDVRWCLTLVITMLSYYFNRDAEHQSYLERYNDSFPEEDDIRQRLARVFTYIDDMNFRTDLRVWQKNDLFTLLVELDRAREILDSLAIAQVREQLNNFYREVNKAASGDQWAYGLAADYFAAIRSGSNDRSSRIRRGEIIGLIIRGEETVLVPSQS